MNISHLNCPLCSGSLDSITRKSCHRFSMNCWKALWSSLIYIDTMQSIVLSTDKRRGAVCISGRNTNIIWTIVNRGRTWIWENTNWVKGSKPNTYIWNSYTMTALSNDVWSPGDRKEACRRIIAGLGLASRKPSWHLSNRTSLRYTYICYVCNVM